MEIRVDQRELADLMRTFKKMPEDIQKKGMDEALLKGAKPIHDAAEQNAPIGGVKWARRRPRAKPLRESIVTRIAKVKRGNKVRVFSTNPIAGPVELGHKFVRDGVDTGKVAAPKPFMRRGFDVNKATALRLIGIDLGKTIERLWKRGNR